MTFRLLRARIIKRARDEPDHLDHAPPLVAVLPPDRAGDRGGQGRLAARAGAQRGCRRAAGRLTDEDLADLDRWAADLLENAEEPRRRAGVGLREVFLPEGWKREGACRDRPEVDFFPGRGQDTKAPRAVCSGCPVRASCLLAAFDLPEGVRAIVGTRGEIGIWGGTSERGRQILWRKRRKILRPVGVIRSSGYRGDQPKPRWVLPPEPRRAPDATEGTTHCPRGHRYKVTPRGEKYCPDCARERYRANRERVAERARAEEPKVPARTGKTHCPRGHRLALEWNGKKYCPACNRERARARYARERAERVTDITWSQIKAECGEDRSRFVEVFRKYEGQVTDDRTARGYIVKVSVGSFARHVGIPDETFRRWVAGKVSQPRGPRALEPPGYHRARFLRRVVAAVADAPGISRKALRVAVKVSGSDPCIADAVALGLVEVRPTGHRKAHYLTAKGKHFLETGELPDPESNDSASSRLVGAGPVLW